MEVLAVNKSVCTQLLPQGSFDTHTGVCICVCKCHCVCVGVVWSTLGEVWCLHRKLNDHRQLIIRSPSKKVQYLSTPLVQQRQLFFQRKTLLQGLESGIRLIYCIFSLLSACAYISTGRKPALNNEVRLTARCA